MDPLDELKSKGLNADRVDEYRAAFEVFDRDQTGRIGIQQLGTLLNEEFGEFSCVVHGYCFVLRIGMSLGVEQHRRGFRP